MIVLKSNSRVWIKQLAFTPSGTAIAAAAGASGLLLWGDLTNGTKAEMPKMPLQGAEGVMYTPDGELLLCAGAELYTVQLATREVRRIPVHSDSTSGIGFAPTPDSSRVVVCEQRYSSDKFTMRSTCWSLYNPDAPVWEVEEDLTFRHGPFFMNAEQYIVIGFHDTRKMCQQVRSSKTGELIMEIPDVPGGVQNVILSPDKMFLAGTSNIFIYVRSVSDPFLEKLVARNDNKKHLAGLAYHPSGKYLAAASNDTTVKFFDTTTWEVVRTFTWKIGSMRAVCFSPDGTLVAAGGAKGQVVVWDVDV